MNIKRIIACGFFMLFCATIQAQYNITIGNPTDQQRQEVIEITLPDGIIRPFIIKNAIGQQLPYQITHDGKLLLEVSVHPKSQTTYSIVGGQPQKMQDYAIGKVYPNRLDDLTWENDKCAYRVYGPALQRRGEKSYGTDVWIKSIPLPVVEYRYNLHLGGWERGIALEKKGLRQEAQELFQSTSFHLDHGEGMDCYGVGPTLGCGAPALLESDGKLRFPYCYKDCKMLDNGPLRFSVELTYNTTADGITEHRLITLDKGSHFNSMTVWYDGIKSPMSFATGVVLHDDAHLVLGKNFVQYADPTENPKLHQSQIYVATLFPNGISETNKDQGHGLGILHNYKGERYTYYFGAAWSHYDIRSQKQWQLCIDEYLKQLQHPLNIQITEQPIAFPGAEGFGRYATGGRGGKVYHVTTLEDNGEKGTLRWANEQEGPKTIVFDVSGTIFLKKPLRFSANTTVAGQTAPGDGICIADFPVMVSSNNIIRYLRFRLGNRQVAHHEGDGLGGSHSQDIIIDHCSISWSIDECLSVYGNKNFTVQWCIISQSLNNAGHQKGAHGYGGNWGGSGASYHHNLLAHHTSRTPRLGPSPYTQEDERMDLRNNVIYNWTANGCYGGEGMTVNIVNNYYKPGPGTPADERGLRIAVPNIRTSQYTHHDSPHPNVWDKMWHIWGKYFIDGNVNSKYSKVTKDNWTYGVYNQINADANDGTYTPETKDTIRLHQPMPFAPVTTQSATEAYKLVLAHAGASLHRDALDKIIVSDVRKGKATFTGKDCEPGIINTQNDIRLGDSPWPELKSLPSPKDTDGDGIPDQWENAHGLDMNNKNDGNTIGDGSYTNLEIYLNSLVLR